jgi:hypothetical protein
MLVNTEAGRPCALDEKLIQRILDAVPKVFSYNQIAGLCRIEPSTFRKWLYRGKTEHLEGKDSIFVELFLRFYERKAECAQLLLDGMLGDKDNFKARAWLLERAYKKDFGAANDEQRHFYGLIASKLSKAGIKLDDYDTFMEDAELTQGDYDGRKEA